MHSSCFHAGLSTKTLKHVSMYWLIGVWLLYTYNIPCKNTTVFTSSLTTGNCIVEPQKPMGEMLPEFLAVREASTASKCLLHDAKDHLRPSASYGSSSRPLTSAPPTKFGKQPLPPLADTPIPKTKLLHKPFAQILLSFPLSFACHCFAGKLKQLRPWLSLYVPLRGSLKKRAIICFYVLNTFWPIRWINDDIRCNNYGYCSFFTQ